MEKKIFLNLYYMATKNKRVALAISLLCQVIPKLLMIIYISVGILMIGSVNILKYLAIPAITLVFVTVFRKRMNSPRPFDELDITPLVGHESGQSFPSRHTASAFVIALAVGNVNSTLGSICIVLAMFTGFTRILAGIHYPTDILVGGLIGIGMGLLYYV